MGPVNICGQRDVVNAEMWRPPPVMPTGAVGLELWQALQLGTVSAAQASGCPVPGTQRQVPCRFAEHLLCPQLHHTHISPGTQTSRGEQIFFSYRQGNGNSGRLLDQGHMTSKGQRHDSIRSLLIPRRVFFLTIPQLQFKASTRADAQSLLLFSRMAGGEVWNYPKGLEPWQLGTRQGIGVGTPQAPT